jgi:hypothetical protein
MDSDEVVDSIECRRDACLDAHSVLLGVIRMMKHCLRIPNDIACTGMPKIEKFFFVDLK